MASNEFGWHPRKSRTFQEFIRQARVLRELTVVQDEAAQALEDLTSEERVGGPSGISRYNRLQNNASGVVAPVEEIEVLEGGDEIGAVCLLPREPEKLENHINLIGLI